jgi:hypothetical protein
MTTQSTKSLTTAELLYVRSDLGTAIAASEQMARAGFKTPKLGQYHDGLYLVAAELKDRGADTGHRPLRSSLCSTCTTYTCGTCPQNRRTP